MSKFFLIAGKFELIKRKFKSYRFSFLGFVGLKKDLLGFVASKLFYFTNKFEKFQIFLYDFHNSLNSNIVYPVLYKNYIT